MRKRLNFSAMILLFFTITMAKAQEDTPYYWLAKARAAIIYNDTLLGIESIEKAIQFGLFDHQALSNSSVFAFLAFDERGGHLWEGICRNRQILSDPKNLSVETGDIVRFWENFDLINEKETEDIFFKNYIKDGSIGLKTFYDIRMNRNLVKYLERIRSLQGYYQSIRTTSMKFESLRPEFVKAAQKLKELYSEAIFPPIYFLMGSLNNVGTPDGYAGMLIGAEHLCKTPDADLDSLTEFDRMVIFDFAQTVPIIVHEYVHLQQKNKPERTLLEYTIMEGAADFVTYLILGQYTNPDVFKFGFANEKRLWEQFEKEMQTEDTDNWLFNSYNSETGYPGNLGYFIGFRICESYFNQALDKKLAIKQILEIQDFDRFLEESKYVND
jgi:hypothetical protein